MEKKTISENRMRRCPRLGDEVTFSYCEHEGGDFPCRLIRRCWEAVFPVDAYFRERLGEEAWVRFCEQTPPDRLSTLLDLVEAAQRRRREKG